MATTRMEKVLTLRLPAPAARKLAARAKALGTTPSAIVREMLARELGGDAGATSLIERTRRYVGSVRDPNASAGRDARIALEDWSPDRRRG